LRQNLRSTRGRSIYFLIFLLFEIRGEKAVRQALQARFGMGRIPASLHGIKLEKAVLYRTMSALADIADLNAKTGSALRFSVSLFAKWSSIKAD
jgi:hypothetical protein